jgi:antitoxin ParD1/3/4
VAVAGTQRSSCRSRDCLDWTAPGERTEDVDICCQAQWPLIKLRVKVAQHQFDQFGRALPIHDPSLASGSNSGQGAGLIWPPVDPFGQAMAMSGRCLPSCHWIKIIPFIGSRAFLQERAILSRVFGHTGVMATEKVTVTIPAEVLEQARAAVAAGQAASVSAYVTEAVRERASRERDVAEMQQRWGPLPDIASEWANRLLDKAEQAARDSS